jgi:protocatechuate 3,4-dioxygenase beta subunit
MRTTLFRLAVATALATVAGPADAQVVERSIQITPSDGTGPIRLPGMEALRASKTGAGRIRGRVVAADGTGPIRRAQVRITSPDIAPKVALTDAEGRFEFRELPASRFTIQATKPGFVSVQYGQARPFESGKPIELADKQALENADVTLPRGGVISGRIVDELGDAVPDVQVAALRQSWANGRRRLTPSPARASQTNDLGQYRIYGLPPGEYYVTASLRGAALEMIEMEVMMLSRTVGTDGPAASAPTSGYAATYYPGTPNAPEAQRVTLAAGQEVSGADFPLVAVRLARVTGLVLGSDGKPLEGAAVSAVPAGREFVSGPVIGPATSRTAKDGTFALNSVPPGEYTLQARAIQVFTSNQGDNVMVFRATTVIGGGDAEFGSMPLTVGGEDVGNLLLTTGKGGTAIGRVTFDGPPPPSMTAIRITSVPIEADGPSLGGGFGAVKEDGTFELKGLTGPRLIRAGSAPPGWTIKTVTLNGIDITDGGAEFRPGETTSGLEVELTSKGTSITGTVTASDGSPVKDYTVVVFSEHSEHWRLPMTRWVTGTRPDQDGRFKVQNLPAGNYYAIAVEYVPQGEWGDPEILDRLKAKARRVQLSDGSAQAIELKVERDY